MPYTCNAQPTISTEDGYVIEMIQQCRDLISRLTDAIGYGRLAPNQITKALLAINWMLSLIQAYNENKLTDIGVSRMFNNEYKPVVLGILESVNM